MVTTMKIISCKADCQRAGLASASLMAPPAMGSRTVNSPMSSRGDTLSI